MIKLSCWLSPLITLFFFLGAFMPRLAIKSIRLLSENVLSSKISLNSMITLMSEDYYNTTALLQTLNRKAQMI